MHRECVVKRFRWPLRVYYEDTDSGGVVYYANYLKFMERARTEWLRSLGFEQDEMMRQDGVIFAVRSVQVDYLQPARFNDALEITAQLRECRRVSLEFQQTVERTGDHPVTLCTGVVRIACLDAASLRPVAIPPRLLKEIPDVG